MLLRVIRADLADLWDLKWICIHFGRIRAPEVGVLNEILSLSGGFVVDLHIYIGIRGFGVFITYLVPFFQDLDLNLSGFVWICMDLYGFVWICMDLYGFVWICMDLYGFVWICMDLYGFVWICMDLYGFVWICMDLYGFVWICMDLYGFVWICMDLYQIWCLCVDLLDLCGFGGFIGFVEICKSQISRGTGFGRMISPSASSEASSACFSTGLTFYSRLLRGQLFIRVMRVAMSWFSNSVFAGLQGRSLHFNGFASPVGIGFEDNPI
uniref:Uncharacterized protein n=1 Tax=Strigamia maritima TaxID=126957 RepID=T1J9J2_STRMM